jgi:hypothetical protein
VQLLALLPMGEAELAGQIEQTPDELKKLAAHALQERDPGEAVHFPTAQTEHVTAPGVTEIVPDGHA